MATSRRESPSSRTRSTRFAAGAQTRKRTDPSGNANAPVRRAGRPCFVSFMGTVLRLSRSRGPRSVEFPARFRFVVAFACDGRPRPSRTGSAGDRLFARRVLPLIATGVALVGCGPPGSHRVLGEVSHGACPRAGGVAADRAEDGIPQATAARHALARLGRSWVLHDRSALLMRPAGHPRGEIAPRLGAAARRRPASPTADSFRSTFVPCPDPTADWPRDAVLPGRRGLARESLKLRWSRRPEPDGLQADEIRCPCKPYASRMPAMVRTSLGEVAVRSRPQSTDCGFGPVGCNAPMGWSSPMKSDPMAIVTRSGPFR